MKLPGLQKYLSQNLGYPVAEVDSYRQLTGSAVVSSANFRENLLSFAVSYGLAIQGLNKGKIGTNLLPREILTDRLIRDKKPWTVGALGAMILGCTISYLSYWMAWNSVHPDKFGSAISQADTVQSSAKNYISNFDAAKAKYDEIDKIGAAIVGNVDNRLLWPELLKAINEALPRDPAGKVPEDIAERREIHVEEIDLEKFNDVSVWYNAVKEKIEEAKRGVFRESDTPPDAAPANAAGTPQPAIPGAAATAVAPPGATPAAPVPATPPGVGVPPATGGDPAALAGGEAPAEGAAAGGGPSGEGWIVQIKGYHFHNKQLSNQSAKFVRDTFIHNLENKKILLPDGPSGKMKLVPIKDLGISCPVIVQSWRVRGVEIRDPNAEAAEQGGLEGPGAGAGMGRRGAEPVPPAATIKLRQYDFVLQFCWQETPLTKRLNPQPAAPADNAGTVAAVGGN
jgi:type IV pilus assembly protein PilM